MCSLAGQPRSGLARETRVNGPSLSSGPTSPCLIAYSLFLRGILISQAVGQQLPDNSIIFTLLAAAPPNLLFWFPVSINDLVPRQWPAVIGRVVLPFHQALH